MTRNQYIFCFFLETKISEFWVLFCPHEIRIYGYIITFNLIFTYKICIIILNMNQNFEPSKYWHEISIFSVSFWESKISEFWVLFCPHEISIYRYKVMIIIEHKSEFWVFRILTRNQYIFCFYLRNKNIRILCLILSARNQYLSIWL